MSQYTLDLKNQTTGFCPGCRVIVDYPGLPYHNAPVVLEEIKTLTIGKTNPITFQAGVFEWHDETHAIPIENFRPREDWRRY